MKFIKQYWQILFIFLLCLTPIAWFVGKGNTILINGLDTNFPLDPLVWFSRRFYIWNNTINGGVDFSSSAAGMFFHFVQTLFYAFKFSLRNVELLSMLFWFSSIVISSYLFSGLLAPKNKIARIIFVVIYSFNVYLFNTWENVKVANLSLMVSLPLIVFLINSFIARTIGKGRFLMGLVATALYSSGAGINPAYFSVIIIAVLINLFVLLFSQKNKQSRKLLLLTFGIALVIIVSINLYWILPLVEYLITKNPTQLSDLGITNWLNSLSENTSLLNVFRLQGAWDWYAVDSYGMPQYLPYSLNYLYKWPFIVFSFVVPVCSVISLIFRKREYLAWYVYFSVLLVLGIFFGCGSHPPTGAFFVFLSEHLPFFSFYRSPWYIFTPLLIMAYAGLSTLLVNNVMIKIKSELKGFFVLALSGMVMCYLVYNYPLITGKIFRPGRNDGFYINFPQYVFDTKEWLNKNNNFKESGRTVAYPDDQLEAFEWNYRGTESILGLFSDIEYVTPSFNNDSSTFAKLLSHFYTRVKRGELKASIEILKYFGADKIFNKNDASTISPRINSENWVGAQKISFGPWDFLKFENINQPKIFSPSNVYKDVNNYEAFIGLSTVLPKDSIVVNGLQDKEIEKISLNNNFLYMEQLTDIFNNKNMVGGIRQYYFNSPKKASYEVVVEKRGLKSSQINLLFDNRKLTYSETDDMVIFNTGLINKGLYNVLIQYPESFNLVQWDEIGKISETYGLRSEELPASRNKTLVLYSSDLQERVVNIGIKQFNPNFSYLFEYEYKFLYGNECVFNFIQSRVNSRVKVESLKVGGSIDWEQRNLVFKPIETDSTLELSFVVSSNISNGRSKTFVENVSFKRIYDNQVFVMEKESGSLSVPQVSYKKISPVRYIIEVSKAPEVGYILNFIENYSKNWKIKRIDQNKTPFDIPHFTVNGFSNGWFIPQGGDIQTYEIYYQPQNLFKVGIFISIVTLTAVIVISLRKRLIKTAK
jgi:hypothetical protein